MSIQLCENGLINDEFPCQNVDVLSFMTLSDIGGGNTNDIWGWTDDLTGKEYAIVGKTTGTAFVDITDPVNPKYLGTLDTNTIASVWRDIKVIGNYAYIGSEATNHGLQIFDLRKLRNLTVSKKFESDVKYGDNIVDGNNYSERFFTGSHNIVSNIDNNVIYGVGGGPSGSLFGKGLSVIDVSNPLNPTPQGFFYDGYIHDAQSVIYNGPDTRYVGKEIVFSANEKWLNVVDVSDKNNIYTISTVSYKTHGYSHQTWLTEDHKFLLSNDEFDERGSTVNNTTTYIFNIEDLEKPFLFKTYKAPTNSIDHNLYTRDKIVYQSNYLSGFRMLDISDIENGIVEEIGYLDIIPTTDSNLTTLGSWSNYPYFESGVVILTDIQNGVWIVKPKYITVNTNTETICYGDNLILELSCLVKIESVTINNLPQTVSYNNNINEKDVTIIFDPFPEVNNETYTFTILINNTYKQEITITVNDCTP